MAKLNVSQNLLDAYAKHIVEDYQKWTRGDHFLSSGFEISFEVGSSYIKVVKRSYNQTSVHSFIVNKAGKFPLGAILKAAGWKAPATNFLRAYIDKPETWVGHVQWTGAQ